jgi:RNA polymerase sigma factor (sigma-70 family)
MNDASLQTVQLHRWLERWEAGDLSAREELLRSVGDRMERLARKLLGDFPRLRRWADTGDVLQNATLRLLRALHDVRPASTRGFFCLAAEQMRRELLDLTRHYYGPHGQGTREVAAMPGDDSSSPALEPIDQTAEEGGDLERWMVFHQAVEQLPVEEREVVGLIFYHGWKQADVAELFQVNERTVRRRWQDALVKLHGILGNND